MVKHIIFDLGNVIVNIHPEKIMKAFAERCHYTEKEIRSFYLSDLHLGFMEGRYEPDHFYSLMMKKFPCDLNQEEFRSIWDQVIGEPKRGIDSLIIELSEDYSLSVCSNTDPWHWEVALRKCPFLNRFERFFLSFEMKVNKPDPLIFKRILETLNAGGEECVFIDDTLDNIETAADFRIQGIHASEPQEMRQGLQEMQVI